MSDAVKTPRKTRLIDTDVHNTMVGPQCLLPHLPRFWREEVQRAGIFIPGGRYLSPIGVLREDARSEPGRQPGSDPAFLMSHHMDRYKIDYAILTGDMFGVSVHSDPDYANVLASAYNDYLAADWLSFSPRFKGSILINHTDPEGAVREIDRVMSKYDGFVQIATGSGSLRLFGQRCFHPIYEAAERYGLPFAIHAGSEGAGTCGPATPSGNPTRYFEWHNIIPTNYMAHVNSMVCEGIFEKFPKLKVVLIEGGIAWLPHLLWRMDKNYKALRSSVPWLKRFPSEYVRDHVLLTTQPIEEPEDQSRILQVFEWIHAEKTLMFASDYPHWDFDNPMMSLPRMPPAMKSRVMGENAAELYNLTEAPVAFADLEEPAEEAVAVHG